MQNRITDAIEVCRIACLAVASDKLDTLSPKLDMDIQEHAAWQERKSLAQSQGKITLDEAMSLYGLLGGTASVHNAQPVHVKIAIIKCLQVLVM